MIYGWWQTAALFGPAVAVGVIFPETGNDGAAAMMAAGVFLMTVAAIRFLSGSGTRRDHASNEEVDRQARRKDSGPTV